MRRKIAMKNLLFNINYTFLITIMVCCFSSHAEAFDQSYTLYNHILKQYVHAGLVDYAGLQANPQDLTIFLESFTVVSKEVFQKFSREEQLAFLINLYNAQTLKLIIDHYPVKSIKDIGSFFKGPWDQPVVKIFGENITLNDLEHSIIRKKYNEPRIHFALVCAALSCPPLREEAYIPQRLNQQFEDQGLIFLSTPQKNRVDLKERVLYLSPIFKWFSKDFMKISGGSSLDFVINFVLPYFPTEISNQISKEKFKVEYTEYDWSLNGV